MSDHTRINFSPGEPGSEKSEEEICATLRHDFMTPLHLITVHSGLLFDSLDDFDPQSMREDLAAIQEATAQLHNMIKSLIRTDRIKIIGDPSLRALDQKIQSNLGTSKAPGTPVNVNKLNPLSKGAEHGQKAVVAARILVVDDVTGNRIALKRLLEPQGYAVDEADSGAQALNMIEGGEYDLLLLDINMPGIDGFTVLEDLKQREILGELPVVMISGRDEVASATFCIALGADAFVTKPFEPAMLMARVESSLERKRSLDTIREVVEALHEEQDKSNRLLRNILPEKVADTLKMTPADKTTLIADRHPEASILFFDLVGFTRLASQIDASALVGLLDKLFSTFDEMTTFLGLEKIKTIGDAYMVAGSLPETMDDHASRMAELALAMIDEVSSIEQETGYELHCRVGLHAGPVVAGVIGSQKFTYDLWGDSVNIASRMESYAPQDRAQVSSEFHDLIKQDFECTKRAGMDIRSVGIVDTYLIDRSRNSGLA